MGLAFATGFATQLGRTGLDKGKMAFTLDRELSAKTGPNWTPITRARAEQAIADDLAFLAAHPTRRSGSNSEAMARKRKFNEAMRERIREVAAFKGLSNQEIKPALSLKHYKLVKFVEERDVNWAWLLEGAGRMFRNDPIKLSSNSSGEEFAAVVATMPPADQQTIRTLVRDIVRDRDQ